MRTAIATISEKSPSSARCMLDAYFPFINPSRRLQRDQMFPRTVRRHVRSEERSTESGNKFLVLFFHVGNTILGYYDAAAAIDGPEDWFNEKATILGNRVRLLEVIAREGIDAFVIEGSDGTGFALAHKKEQREKAEFKDDSRFMH